MENPGTLKPTKPVVAGAPVVGPKTGLGKLLDSRNFTGRSIGKGPRVSKEPKMTSKRR